MPVPKRKTSKGRRDRRRSHHKVEPVNFVEDKETKNLRRSHFVDQESNTYKGKKVK